MGILTDEWVRKVEAQRHFAWSVFRTRVEEGERDASEWELFWLEWVGLATVRRVVEEHKPTTEQMAGCPPCDHDGMWCNLFYKKDMNWCEDCWTAYNIAKNLQTLKQELGL